MLHEIKEKRLDDLLREMDKLLVAYSGGVDSTFLLFKAVQVVGKANVIAVTGVSETLPQSDLNTINRIIGQLGVAHREVRTKELTDPRFSRNPENRCYYCKDELYSRLTRIAEEKGYPHIIDGTNADDEMDYRPGLVAAREHGILSPLRDAGLTKEEIRSLSRGYGLETWDKPSSPCLSSRFPYGTLITAEKLSQVEKAEAYLRTLGLKEFRVRHLDHTARIELLPTDMSRLLDEKVKGPLVNYFHSLGYIYVTLDLEGFRSGNLNKTINLSSDNKRYVAQGDSGGK